MNVQKSAVPTLTTQKTRSDDKEHTLDLDPYAAPNVYYGASHSTRKVAKSRTYSAVSH